MGVLDDAIRQHLELKRQHGAEESELRRKEDEALGPARREAPVADQERADQPEGDPSAEALHAGAAPEEEAHAGGVPEEQALPPIDDPAESTAAQEPAGSEHLGADEPAADYPQGTREPASEELGVLEEDDPFDEPFAPEEPALESREGEVREERRPLAEGELEHEGEPVEEGEDVLEETPDFLQETPEHDRLWFEQKPPRDFDFDDE